MLFGLRFTLGVGAGEQHLPEDNTADSHREARRVRNLNFHFGKLLKVSIS